mmetsp:Transcript_34611/g.114655  ORF Transcript_34611/g.114655 Transcript_34611/m.114655 type:complete len:89 (-) Transcript_34611:673-939(-)
MPVWSVRMELSCSQNIAEVKRPNSSASNSSRNIYSIETGSCGPNVLMTAVTQQERCAALRQGGSAECAIPTTGLDPQWIRYYLGEVWY